MNDVLQAFSDESLNEDFRLHLNGHEMHHDKGVQIYVQKMPTDLDKKYYNLLKAGNWMNPSSSGVDAKHVSLLVSAN